MQILKKRAWLLVVLILISFIFIHFSCKEKKVNKIDKREQLYRTNDSLDLISRDTLFLKIGNTSKKIKIAWSRNTTKNQQKFISELLSKLIYVEGGKFSLGCMASVDTLCTDYEKPIQNVQLSSFFISQYEITQLLFLEVMGYNPNPFKNNYYPVSNVSWVEANEFIKKLNHITSLHFQLPTEAQWEYAAKGGNKSKKTIFAGNKDINKVAWYKNNSKGLYHIVGLLSPNELNVHDLSGNVWEWCRDYYAPYTPEDKVNPTGPNVGTVRVYRGGSWIDNMNYTRVTFRNSGNPNLKMNCLGFRVILIP